MCTDGETEICSFEVASLTFLVQVTYQVMIEKLCQDGDLVGAK